MIKIKKQILNDADSFAVFANQQLHDELSKESDISIIAKKHRDNYRPDVFPDDRDDLVQIDEDYVLYNNPHYAIVGLNPGNAANEKHPLLWAFHGSKQSGTHRLAAAIQNTPLEGCVMTDLSPHKIESDSNKVKILPEDIIALDKHLDDLQVDDDATIFILGRKVKQEILQENLKSHRKIVIIPHYSGQNIGNRENHRWNTAEVHEDILRLISNN